MGHLEDFGSAVPVKIDRHGWRPEPNVLLSSRILSLVLGTASRRQHSTLREVSEGESTAGTLCLSRCTIWGRHDPQLRVLPEISEVKYHGVGMRGKFGPALGCGGYALLGHILLRSYLSSEAFTWLY